MENKLKKYISSHSGEKARKIANSLKLDRAEVSRFLHDSPDYEQDEDFCWCLVADNNVFEINLEADTWITASDFESCLINTGCALSSDTNEVKVIFPKGCSVMLDVSARLLALVNQLDYAGKSVALDFTQCAQTKGYFNRMGFFDHLREGVSVLPRRPKESGAVKYKGNNSALVEFGGINPGCRNKQLVGDLSDSFVEQSSEDYETASFTIFSELIGNISEHSESPLEGFAALQKYKGRKTHIQTVVSDSGLGIAQTLRPSLKGHYPDLYKKYNDQTIDNDIELVIQVLSKGEVSRYGKGRGLGFKSSREQSMKFNASYSVRQETFSLDFQFEEGKLKEVRRMTNLSKIQGTHICFDFYVD